MKKLTMPDEVWMLKNDMGVHEQQFFRMEGDVWMVRYFHNAIFDREELFGPASMDIHREDLWNMGYFRK